jgi:NAD(P)-dependent dehydrogenase (short-subunit alcohol dehydrogenase family)
MSETDQKNNNALVWGASGGMGRAIVTKLVEEGWNVVAISRNPEKVKDLTPYSFEADVSDPITVENAFITILEEFEIFELWIYAVGDIIAEKVTKMTIPTWHRILNANLTGAFIATHYSLPVLARDAHLFYIGAISESLILPKLTAYVAAKSGLEAFVKALMKEERKKKITIVRPGAVDTLFWEKVPFSLPEGALKPEQLAEEILDAYKEEYKGILDL